VERVDAESVALESFEALADAIGPQAARLALHVLAGHAPTLTAVDRALARRRLPELLQRRPGASTRDLAKWLGTSHATVQRWLREMERDGSNRSRPSSDTGPR
jgi:hypothetical protein